jgi:hypothetical protein
MKAALMVALLLLGNIFPTGLCAIKRPTESPVQDNGKEAERIWELAIAAKGGRDRLHAVNNLQVSIREKVWYKLRLVPYIEEDLYVFPNKYWEWNDQRKTIFGFDIRVYNQDRDIDLWYTDRGEGGHVGRPVDWVHGKAGLITLYDVQLRYFTETKWVRPIPVSVDQTKLGGHSVDIVQTIVKGYPTKDGKDEQRIAFALDRQTHLPLQVIYYTVTFGKEYSGGVPLSDYMDVGGIQMPSNVYGLKAQCQINVDYNEEIFLREPNVGAGIAQWKKK